MGIFPAFLIAKSPALFVILSKRSLNLLVYFLLFGVVQSWCIGVAVGEFPRPFIPVGGGSAVYFLVAIFKVAVRAPLSFADITLWVSPVRWVVSGVPWR